MPPAPFDSAALAASLARGGRLRLDGLRGSSPSFVIAAMAPDLPGPLLWVAPDEEQAIHAHGELREYLGDRGDRRVQHYPASDVAPYGGMSPHAAISRRRIEILARLQDGRPDLVVASVPALLKRVVPRATLGNAQELLAVGEEIDRDALVASLIEWGYLSTNRAEDPGCFSVRGHVFDLFAPAFDAPLRIELWGDEIESIRLFDPATQRSLMNIDEVVVLPVREEIFDAADTRRFGRTLKVISDERGQPPRQRARLEQELEQGRYFAGIEDYLPLIHPEPDTFFDYLGPEASVILGGDLDAAVVDEPVRIRRAFESGDAYAALAPEPADLYLGEEEFHQALAGRPTLTLPELKLEEDTHPGEEVVPFVTSDHGSLRTEILAAREKEGGMLSPLLERLQRWQKDGLKVLLACGNRVQAERIGALLEERDVMWTMVEAPLRAARLRDSKDPLRQLPQQLTLTTASLDRGFAFPAASVVVVARSEIFGARQRRRQRKRDRLGHALSSFSELKDGDFVVHATHGVSRYLGMHKIETPKSQSQKRQEFLQRARDPRYKVGDADIGQLEARGSHNDYLLLEYRGGDRLYMPVHKLDLLHRYAAVEGAAPPLDRLGGQSWSRRKSKVEEAVQKLAAHLLELYATRQSLSGNAFGPPDGLYREFAASFPFEETEDQLEAIRAIQEELVDPRPMDRLVSGDVGYGKTEVALRAIFQVIASGYQAAVLVPTTILALQHYLTFQERLAAFPVKVEMLSRFRSAKERREVMKGLSSGGLDVVIGTHALLGRDVNFKRLGLLVIDEEHRFGVKQKEKIQTLKKGVDVLSMTATPIPRTMNMALSGLRTFSLIDTPPAGRQEVRTFMLRFSPQRVKDAIELELRRGGQVFFVYNRVQSIHAMESFLKRLLPGTSIGVAHGQMSEGQLEKVMVDFVRRRYQVLLCTTIIESGIDIPTCNTILIHRADRLGLAQLYQLRGRVGRGRHRGYAYMLVPPGRPVAGDAAKRLKALQDNTSLGSGFKIASRDLEIRGAGNLLGKEQSGNVNAVGLHTYLEMLQGAMKTLKGEQGEAPKPEIEIKTDAYIPSDYIPDQRDRLLYYKQLSDATSEEEAQGLMEELDDLYGRVPEPVKRLLELIQLKVVARQLWVTRVNPLRDGVRMTFHEETPVDPARLATLVQRGKGRLTLSTDGKLTLRLGREQRKDPLQILTALLRRLI